MDHCPVALCASPGARCLVSMAWATGIVASVHSTTNCTGTAFSPPLSMTQSHQLRRHRLRQLQLQPRLQILIPARGQVAQTQLHLRKPILQSLRDYQVLRSTISFCVLAILRTMTRPQTLKRKTQMYLFLRAACIPSTGESGATCQAQRRPVAGYAHLTSPTSLPCKMQSATRSASSTGRVTPATTFITTITEPTGGMLIPKKKRKDPQCRRSTDLLTSRPTQARRRPRPSYGPTLHPWIRNSAMRARYWSVLHPARTSVTISGLQSA